MHRIGSKRERPRSHLWVVVPTYWGPADHAIYDHPTPIDGQSTLPRLLESLAKQGKKVDFTVMVLVSTVGADHVQAATATVRRLLSPYQERINLILVDAVTADVLDTWLNRRGFDAQISGMRGYASVRNCQLLIPAVFGAEVIAALDDDEVVGPDYLSQVTKWMGEAEGEERVLGKAGPYLDAMGSPYLSEPEQQRDILSDKSIFINQAMRQLLTWSGSLSPTPMALGGNMVFHRDLFTRVGFDPAITRGEDIDYVINAKMAGIQFYFDAKLIITHLPPRHYEAPAYGKLRQDVFRFMYEREKLLLGGLSADAFSPYPGRLLGNDLEEEARSALETAVTPDMRKHFGSPQEIIRSAQLYAQNHAPRYFQFARQWVEMAAALADDSELAAQLLSE